MLFFKLKLGPPTSRAFFFPLDHTGYEIGGPLRPAPPIAASLILPVMFWGQNYVPVRPYGLTFIVFFLFLYSFLIFSFCYSLLILLSFLISFYSYLLFLLFLSLLILLILLVLFFVFIFSYILICLLYYRHAD